MGFRTIAATSSDLYAIDDSGFVWKYGHNAALGWHWQEMTSKQVPLVNMGGLANAAPPGWPANVPYPPQAPGTAPGYPPQAGAPPSAVGKASCHAPPVPPVVVSPTAPSAAAPYVPPDRNAPAGPPPAVSPPGGDLTRMGVAPPK
jgi:hypothetical protein